MAKLFAFNRGDATALKGIIKEYPKHGHNLVPPPGAAPMMAGGSAAAIWIMQATTEITEPAFSPYIVPGAGMAKIMKLYAGELVAHEDNDKEVTTLVYNLLPHVIPIGGLLEVNRTLDGTLWVARWLDFPNMFCEFELTEELTTSMSEATGDIVDDTYYAGSHREWYGGRAHTISTGLTFLNLETHTAGEYLFEGEVGHRGKASWGGGTTWHIDIMECP